jgi:hypothetical protein
MLVTFNRECVFIVLARVSILLYLQQLLHNAFQASAAVEMKHALFWDFTQRRIVFLTDVSGQPIRTIFELNSSRTAIKCF